MLERSSLSPLETVGLLEEKPTVKVIRAVKSELQRLTGHQPKDYLGQLIAELTKLTGHTRK